MNINIIKHNTILYLNNIEYSPYWDTLYNSCIKHDKDNNGNVIFYEDYDLDHIMCYIDHCNNGYIRRESFNRDLFEYMGHEFDISAEPILQLQSQWKKQYGGYVPYEQVYHRELDVELDELISTMNNLFRDVEYIYAGLADGKCMTHKVIVFCPRNDCNYRLHYGGYIFLIRYVEEDINPRDYIIKREIDSCIYREIYYMDSIIE